MAAAAAFLDKGTWDLKQPSLQPAAAAAAVAAVVWKTAATPFAEWFESWLTWTCGESRTAFLLVPQTYKTEV